MARCTFQIEPMVRVEIAGELNPKGPHCLRLDKGLVTRFLEWQRSADVWPATRGGVTSPGLYVGFYTVKDAERIRAWLLEQGVTDAPAARWPE